MSESAAVKTTGSGAEAPDMQALADQIVAMTGAQLDDLLARVGANVGALDRLRQAVQEYGHGDLEQAVLDKVRETCEAHGLTDVVGVVFTATEWDNGYFLEGESGVVYCTDGTATVQEFKVHDELTDWIGVVGASFALAVRPAQGDTFHDNYDSDVYDWLGVDPSKYEFTPVTP